MEEARQGSRVGHEFHNVVFLILNGEGQLEGQIKAHKVVLSSASPISRTQFRGNYVENHKQENGVTQIEIRDSSFAAFDAMIRNVYDVTDHFKRS